jgi:hypothetical protein
LPHSPECVGEAFLEATLPRMSSLLRRCGAWLFASDSFFFQDLTHRFWRGDWDSSLAEHVVYQAGQAFELLVDGRVLPLFAHLLDAGLAQRPMYAKVQGEIVPHRSGRQRSILCKYAKD